MKKLRGATFALLIAAMAIPASATTIIDPYTDGQFGALLGPQVGGTLGPAIPVSAFIRTVYATQSGVPASTTLFSSGGLLDLQTGSATTASFIIDYTSGGVDLTGGGANELEFSSTSNLGYTLALIVNGVTSSLTPTVPSGNVMTPYAIPFSTFVGVNWSNVTNIQIVATSGALDSDVGFENLVAAKPIPEPGTYALLGSGLLALAGFARRRKA